MPKPVKRDLRKVRDSEAKAVEARAAEQGKRHPAVPEFKSPAERAAWKRSMLDTLKVSQNLGLIRPASKFPAIGQKPPKPAE